jgi:hypothetical protein
VIVQIDNTNAKTALSGHVLKNDCPDRVDYGAKSGRNIDKTDAVIESGHRAKSVDKPDVNGISGHVSGHNEIQNSSKGHFMSQTVL